MATHGKPVAKYDADGNYQAWYPSIASAARSVGVSIGSVQRALNCGSLCRGSQWRFVSDGEEDAKEKSIGVHQDGRTRGRRVKRYDICGRYECTYPTLAAAARAAGVHITSVYQAVRYGCRCGGGYYSYADGADGGEENAGA